MNNYVIWTILKTWTIMLFELIFNNTFILFERFSKHEQLCGLNEFPEYELLCYLKRLFYKTSILFEWFFKWTIMLIERIFKYEILCYFWTIMLFEHLIKLLSYSNDFQNMNNYVIWTNWQWNIYLICEQLCYLNDFLIKHLSYLNDFQNMKNYVI